MTLTIQEATHLQQQAADPSASKQVNANAGSGKTKVLVDRVSRLLLQGTKPDKILCLTYTRAAASEMQKRLFDKLSEWSVASEAELAEAMEGLFGKPVGKIVPAIELGKVRTLFASALETPEGLKVMTIHAFCDQVIRRFPIEAGILPGFQAIEDADIERLLVECRTRLLRAARSDKKLGDALHRLSLKMADSTLDGLLFHAALNFEAINHWDHSGGIAPFRKAVSLGPGETVEWVAARAWEEMDHSHLRGYGELCRGAGGYATKFGDAIADALNADDPATAFKIYSAAFLTGKGTITSQLPAKALSEQDPFLTKDSPELTRVEQAVHKMRAVNISDMSEAILTLGHWMGQDYLRAKRRERVMDFNDLIRLTRDLLTKKAVSDWVAYKLDGGIEHVLLDEAQDTAPDQWKIINALSEPFAQDPPDRDALPRTFFAVGDPKQSIYRFQGAAPSIFMESFRTQRAAEEIRLRMSFRSTQAVLDMVDGLFIDQNGLTAMFDADAMPETSDLIRHVAAREDPGCVELWPLVPKSDAVEDRDAWDTTPVDAQDAGDPRVRLAKEIAHTIQRWVDQKEIICVRENDEFVFRPIHAGDVLILVQKRVGGLFDALIRELKRLDLPVAGADRLILQEATIVRDLLALTRFVLLPSDDLSLAEVLKSPLFGLDDEALFALCVDRGEATLWEMVQTRAPELANYLQTCLDARQATPFDFYAQILDREGPHEMRYREALLRRLGREAREALDAFLTQALTFQQNDAPSLQGFLQRFTTDEVEIKRDKDPAGREVRIMTVHGAKGLEAPIVFLPDTTRAPKASSGGLIKAGEGFVLTPSSAESIPLVEAYKEADHLEEQREYMRLLYVAMTRAETRLIVCGHETGRSKVGMAEGCWYQWAQKTFADFNVEPFETAFDGNGRQGLRFGRSLDAQADAGSQPGHPETALPNWINRPVPAEDRAVRTASPSSLLQQDDPIGRRPGRARPTRGIAIHKLLEILPDHSPDRRADLGRTLLDRYPELSDADRDLVLGEVLAVLDDPAFEPVFSDGSRAEVSLAGRVESIRDGSVFMTAQIDRLAVDETSVTLLDYKSNREVPTTIEDVDPVYIAQMAAYRELARTIWPGKTIRCDLLWTQVPKLMRLPDPVMDAVLTQVNALPTSL